MPIDSKYKPEVLIPLFIKAAHFRNELIELGFTDNGGAIHTCERILGILAQKVKYPGLGHLNTYKNYPSAEFSERAWKAKKRGEPVFIEHVAPHRDFTKRAVELVANEDGEAAAKKLVSYIKRHFRLVLLTREETDTLNKRNRSKMDSDRLQGITLQETRRDSSKPRG